MGTAMAKRIRVLEDAAGMSGGWDISKPCHLVGVPEGGDDGRDYASALATYIAKHPDKRVAGDHNVIWLAFVEPKFNEAGERILMCGREPEPPAPSLTAVLTQLEKLEG